jgi:hypothetical protein
MIVMMIVDGNLGNLGNVIVMRMLHESNLHCLLMNGPTRHAHGRGSRMKRQHGYQKPKQECLEGGFHVNGKYTSQPENAKSKIALPIVGRSSAADQKNDMPAFEEKRYHRRTIRRAAWP